MLRIAFVGIGGAQQGSHRIYGHYLSSLLELEGARVSRNRKLSGNEDVVIVGKGINELLPSWQLTGPKVGLINPSIPRVRNMPRADFYIVGSAEEAESLAFTRKPRLVFPQIEPNILEPRIHEKQPTPLTLVYHGNREHLEQVSPSAVTGLAAARQQIDFELKLVYNWKQLGRAESFSGAPFAVRHVQWSQQSFQREILSSDIGIAFANAPVSIQSKLQRALSKDDARDHLIIAVKRLNNVGRALLMTQLGLPVVAEMSPSIFSLYANPARGYLCKSAESWEEAVVELGSSVQLRQEMSEAALVQARREYNPREHAARVIRELTQIVNDGGAAD